MPDVTFADGGTSAVVTVVPEAGVSDAGAGAGTVDASDASTTVFSCPDLPPPAGTGVCCGSQLCLKCSAAQCDRCQKADCEGNEVCCAKNAGTSGNSISCQPRASCN